jgi:hypothetical protein
MPTDDWWVHLEIEFFALQRFLVPSSNLEVFGYGLRAWTPERFAWMLPDPLPSR